MTRLLIAFLILCLAVGIGLPAFYSALKDGRLKRQLHPWLVAIPALAFGGFLFVSGMPASVLWVFLLLLALVTYANIRWITFCNACGGLAYSRMISCPKCGTPMNAR